MENQLPKRKKIRLSDYDYSMPGAYFITVCTANRKALFWANVGADNIRPNDIKLSAIGEIIDYAIKNIPISYPHINVDKYCIMPDHIHLLLVINADIDGRMISAPTVSTVIGQFKRFVSKQVGFPLWQKSFIDEIIRNEQHYLTTWQYIDNNHLKYSLEKQEKGARNGQ